jgi:hypothetical protein
LRNYLQVPDKNVTRSEKIHIVFVAIKGIWYEPRDIDETAEEEEEAIDEEIEEDR